MSDDMKKKMIQEIRSSPACIFPIQLNDSMDVGSYAQLLVFVRYYVFLCGIKNKSLLYTQLETTARAADVMEKLSFSLKLAGSPGKIVLESVQTVL